MRIIMIKSYTIAAVLLLSIMTSIPAVTGGYEPDKLRVHLRMDKKYFYSDEDVRSRCASKMFPKKKIILWSMIPAGGELSNYTTFQPLVYDLDGRMRK